jgi:hypothetical protein
MAQILSAQIYTTADEIPSFPGCESITDNAQKCFCNQSQMLIIGETTGQIAQIEMVIDGNGWINSWRVTNITDVDILAKVDFMMSSMRHNIRLTPARINGKPVNYQMVMMLSTIKLKS